MCVNWQTTPAQLTKAFEIILCEYYM